MHHKDLLQLVIVSDCDQIILGYPLDSKLILTKNRLSTEIQIVQIFELALDLIWKTSQVFGRIVHTLHFIIEGYLKPFHFFEFLLLHGITHLNK